MSARIQPLDLSIETRRAPVEPLEHGEIHVWLFDFDASQPRMAVPALARAKLKDLLRHYGQCQDLPEFRIGEHGKPRIAAVGFPHFNLSHAGHAAAMAFAFDDELGIDIEAPDRRLHALDLARRFFDAREADALAALPDTERETAFMRLWTCKEAMLKALGAGISFGLDRLCFGLDAGGRPQALLEIDASAGQPDDWQIHHFDVAPSSLCSLAWRGGARRLRVFRGG